MLTDMKKRHIFSFSDLNDIHALKTTSGIAKPYDDDDSPSFFSSACLSFFTTDYV